MNIYSIYVKFKLKNISNDILQNIYSTDKLFQYSNWMLFLIYLFNIFKYFKYKLYKQKIFILNKNMKYNFFIKNKIVIFKNKKNKRFYYDSLKSSIMLTNVIIDDSIEIPKNAFSCCYNLKKVYIKKGIKIINTHAFENCVQLKYIYIPKDIEYIAENSFLNCISLKKIFFY